MVPRALRGRDSEYETKKWGMKRTDEWSVPYHGWGDEPMGAAGGDGALAIYIYMHVR